MIEHTLSRKVREATVSGLFYPAEAKNLEREVASLVDSCSVSPTPLVGIISPHGSFPYSGALEATAWKAASGQNLSSIVLLAPSHRSYDEGIFLPESSAFAVPTGRLSVDTRKVHRLKKTNAAVIQHDIPHLEEHSIELQLPFVAHFYPEVPIVPIIVSDRNHVLASSLCASLEEIFARELDSTLFVISSNMAVEAQAVACEAATREIVEGILSMSPEALFALSADRKNCCAGAFMAAYLRHSFFAKFSPILFGLGTSAKMRGNEDEEVVGYASIGFSR